MSGDARHAILSAPTHNKTSAGSHSAWVPRQKTSPVLLHSKLSIHVIPSPHAYTGRNTPFVGTHELPTNGLSLRIADPALYAGCRSAHHSPSPQSHELPPPQYHRCRASLRGRPRARVSSRLTTFCHQPGFALSRRGASPTAARCCNAPP